MATLLRAIATTALRMMNYTHSVVNAIFMSENTFTVQSSRLWNAIDEHAQYLMANDEMLLSILKTFLPKLLKVCRSLAHYAKLLCAAEQSVA